MISTISDQIIQEGNTLRVISNIDANPVSMLVWWSSSSELSFRQYGPVLIIRNIQRTYSGYYTCHSMNTLIPSGQPSQNRTSVKRFYVSVQCKWYCEIISMADFKTVFFTNIDKVFLLYYIFHRVRILLE